MGGGGGGGKEGWVSLQAPDSSLEVDALAEVCWPSVRRLACPTTPLAHFRTLFDRTLKHAKFKCHSITGRGVIVEAEGLQHLPSHSPLVPSHYCARCLVAQTRQQLFAEHDRIHKLAADSSRTAQPQLATDVTDKGPSAATPYHFARGKSRQGSRNAFQLHRNMCVTESASCCILEMGIPCCVPAIAVGRG